jgi:hypothetical protein
MVCYCTGQCRKTGYCPVAGFDNRFDHAPDCKCFDKFIPACRRSKTISEINSINDDIARINSIDYDVSQINSWWDFK